MNNQNRIDVVITWVDGNDPVHQQKMQPFLNKLNSVSDDVAGPTRFRSIGEIYYCVASILRFAPFVRKIFIVTDQQNPDLDDFVKLNFPDNNTQIIIVDHTVIFKGYEKYLPVFNSISIETCLYRIPELSEDFVYFNDDFFLTRPIKPENWFINNKVVAYGYWRSLFLDRLLWLIKPKKNGRKPFGYKDSIINAAKLIVKKGTYFYMNHAPLPMKKSVLEKYFDEYSDKLISNISHKFRHETQFNPQALFYLLAFKTNSCITVEKDNSLFIKPVNRSTSYVDRKIKTLEDNPEILFCCIESLDLATEIDKQKIFEWLRKTIIIKFETE